ncbi:MAG TPA: hypothetical protein VM939_11130, partial [Gemmatimonadaceae bacterium]|nr:hypothetical protein [Gemmatimonadaceae bacterium]
AGNQELATADVARFTDIEPSPEGKRIAVIRDGDVWVYDRDRKIFSRLTRTEQEELSLVWSRDGASVLYSRDVPNFDVFRRAADGSGVEEALLSSLSDESASSFSRDGSVLLYDLTDAQNDIHALTLGSNARTTAPLISAAGSQRGGMFSPDGMWVAYTSSESGRNEIYLAPYPVDRGPRRQQVSGAGGENARWGPDGRTLYYQWSKKVIRVRINPRTGEIGKPEILERVPAGVALSLAPDGRFLVAVPRAGSLRRSVKVVLNWDSMVRAGK